MKLTTTNVRVFRIELEFGSVGFCGEGNTGEPGEKALRAKREPTTKSTRIGRYVKAQPRS